MIFLKLQRANRNYCAVDVLEMATILSLTTEDYNLDMGVGELSLERAKQEIPRYRSQKAESRLLCR